MGLTREVQIGCGLQTDEATPLVTGTTAMTAAFYSRELSSDPRVNINSISYRRGSRKSSLSRSPKLIGPGLMEIIWEQELAGGSSSVAASWHAPLRACGFAAPVTVKKITIDAAGTTTATVGGSNTFRIGDKIGNNATEGSATVTATVVHHYKPPAGTAETLFIIPGTGAFGASDTVHNYSQPGLTSPSDSTPSDGGYAFKPISEGGGTVPPVATVEERADGKIFRAVGARGNAKITAEHGKPMMVEFTFRGPWDHTGGNPYTAGFVGSVPAVPKPPMVGKFGYPFMLDAYSPILMSATLDLGNQLTDRRCISEAGIVINGLPVGYLATRITDREPVVSIDPESVPTATFAFVGKWQNEAPFTFLQRVGSPADTSGAVIVHAPAAAFDNDSWSQQDRDGIRTENPTILCSGSADDELTIYHIFLA
jgi:hypothetical protein